MFVHKGTLWSKTIHPNPWHSLPIGCSLNCQGSISSTLGASSLTQSSTPFSCLHTYHFRLWDGQSVGSVYASQGCLGFKPFGVPMRQPRWDLGLWANLITHLIRCCHIEMFHLPSGRLKVKLSGCSINRSLPMTSEPDNLFPFSHTPILRATAKDGVEL